MRDIARKLEIGFEEIVLAMLILFEILDFFAAIPPIMEFAEKVIAIITMCYLFYKASMTKIVFGVKDRKHDMIIIIAYLLLSLKTVVGFVISSMHEKSIVTGIYTWIVQNADTIEKAGFWIGGLALLAVSYVLVHEKIKKPCILSIIHETRSAETASQKLVRFISNYITLTAIFVVVFTLAIEWLAMTVDAPILMIILFFYLFVIVKRGKGMKTESFLKKVSEASENFYERFISLFHSRRTIGVAITGLLVLHLLIEIGNFIIPYTTGIMYPKYFAQMGTGHLPLGTLAAQDFAAASGAAGHIGVMLVYILNVLAILMLFFGPAYAWTMLYAKRERKKADLKKASDIPNVIWLFFGSLAMFIMLPVFRMSRVGSGMLVGADITTQQIPFMENIWTAILISAV
ncbi:hypothetical protein KY363_08435, partial [Candidatus Woesearchaeota archaeon]|nr:hypothetical protein [Candidatus Woesearchaeota archaeon]